MQTVTWSRLSICLCCLIVGMVCLSSFGVSAYGASVVDGPIAQEKLVRDVRDLLYQQKFDELERLAARLRREKIRFPEGHWQLGYFYDGVDQPPKGPVVQPIPKWKWDRHFALLDKWRKAYPNSITARVATARTWIVYGWDARGSDVASAVTAEGWALLAQRLKRASELLHEAPALQKDDCPERFNSLLALGRAEGWPRDKFMKLFKAAVAFEPRYYAFYSAVAYYLTPRWGGEDGEWLRFVENADAMAGDPGGREIYTRIVAGLFDSEWNTFDDTLVSWAKMKRGFQDMEARYPDSPYNLNNFALNACLAGDMNLARTLLQKIGTAPYLRSWRVAYPLYDECRKATGVGGPMRAEIKESQEKLQGQMLADQGDKYSQFWAVAELPSVSPRDKNYAKVIGMLQASAEQGYAPAQSALGIRLSSYARDKESRAQAISWVERAALQDDDAKYLLPTMYEYGLAQNLVKAYAWYLYNDTEAGRAGVEKLSKVLTPEQQAEGKREAERIHAIIHAMP